MPSRRALLSALAALPALAACKTDFMHCTADMDGCYEVASGRYLARAPADADGLLPVLVYFHGYSSSAENTAKRSWLVDTARERGVLLVLPDGVDNTWSHDGSPHQDRDEIAFFDDVLADVGARWAIDPARIYASGFSQGGSMAWYVACDRGAVLAAAFPASGAFWEPAPTTCSGGPVNLRHTHGTADSTVPMEGRPIGNSHQGDVLEGMALWRDQDGCDEAASRTEPAGEATCEVWDDCSSGKELWLCLHDGGHERPSGWLDDQLDWAGSL